MNEKDQTNPYCDKPGHEAHEGNCLTCYLEDDIVYRLRKRAEIRRQIVGRKSVQEGQRDRISDLLEEAADKIEELRIIWDQP